MKGDQKCRKCACTVWPQDLVWLGYKMNCEQPLAFPKRSPSRSRTMASLFLGTPGAQSYSLQWGGTLVIEINTASLIIDIFWPFQVNIIYQNTLPQYNLGPWGLATSFDVSLWRNSIPRRWNFSCALCYQDLDESGYKMNDKWILTCFKCPPNFRTIASLVSEKLDAQSCTLLWPYSSRFSSIVNADRHGTPYQME